MTTDVVGADPRALVVQVCDVAVGLLADPAVAAAWERPSALDGMLRQRFGDVSVSSAGDRLFVACTTIRCTVADQSALRALLTQVWDFGGEVVLLAEEAHGPHGKEQS